VGRREGRAMGKGSPLILKDRGGYPKDKGVEL